MLCESDLKRGWDHWSSVLAAVCFNHKVNFVNIKLKNTTLFSKQRWYFWLDKIHFGWWFIKSPRGVNPKVPAPSKGFRAPSDGSVTDHNTYWGAVAQ